jgi:hypothetical protein
MRVFQGGPEQGARPIRMPVISTAIALAVGSLVLADLLIDLPLLNLIGSLLVEYGLIIAVFALMLGVLNVLQVHSRKVIARDSGWPYSILLLMTIVFIVAAGILGGVESPIISWTVVTVLLPLQSAFFSLLAFFLLAVAYRAMHVRSFESLLLVGSAALVILGTTVAGTISPLLGDVRNYILAVPATAGMRGLLLGIAIGTIATGVRFAFDSHRYFK